MAHILAARVAATSTSSGTDDFLLTGGMVAHRPFSAVLQTGDTTEYLAYAATDGEATGQWEAGMCEYFGPEDAGGERIERLSPMENSTRTYSHVGALRRLDFAAGSKVVILTPTAERLSYVPCGGETGQVLNMTGDGPTWGWPGPPGIPNYEYPLNRYVRTDGDDANTGTENTPSGAYRTIQRALLEASQARLVTAEAFCIRVGPGMHDSVYDGSPDSVSWPAPDKPFYCRSVFISGPYDAVAALPEQVDWSVSGVQLRMQYMALSKGATTWSSSLFLQDCTLGDEGNLPGDWNGLAAMGTGSLLAHRCTFTGAWDSLAYASGGANIDMTGTVLAGSPTFSGPIIKAEWRSTITLQDAITGVPALGVRYDLSSFSQLWANGLADTTLPGDAPGVADASSFFG